MIKIYYAFLVYLVFSMFLSCPLLSCLGFVLHGWMTLNGNLKVKMGAVGVGIVGHGLMMVTIETVDGERC